MSRMLFSGGTVVTIYGGPATVSVRGNLVYGEVGV
jgi:hypothetical protein